MIARQADLKMFGRFIKHPNILMQVIYFCIINRAYINKKSK
jgi:hypothetical protein